MTTAGAREHPVPQRSARHGLRTPGIWTILLGGLVLRLVIDFVLIPGQGFRDDLRLFEEWASTLATVGPGAFYHNTLPAGLSPGYLYTPGYLYVLWVVGAVARAVAGITGETQAASLQQLIKLPAIMADVAIAFVLYQVAGRWSSRRAGAIAASLYLFIPITWYDSAVWGQVDAVGTLLLLVSIVLLIRGWSEPSLVVAVAAAVTKPQYVIGLVVVGSVLIGRHLIRSGSGPIPRLGPIAGKFDRRLGGWFTQQQGLRRLAAAFVSAIVAFLILVVPFDLSALAPDRFAHLPVVGDIAGFLILVRSAAGYYPYLTVNAFNGWAFIGSTPLVDGLAHGSTRTLDAIQVIGPVSAVVVGAALMAAMTLLVSAVLVLRNGRDAILVGFTVLALAFFILPTRSHERYLFPALASGALLAATSVTWRTWLIALGLAQAANVHAVLTLPQYGGPGLAQAPLALELQSPAAIVALSTIQTVLLVAATVGFVQRFAAPALIEGWAALRRRWIGPPGVP